MTNGDYTPDTRLAILEDRYRILKVDQQDVASELRAMRQQTDESNKLFDQKMERFAQTLQQYAEESRKALDAHTEKTSALIADNAQIAADAQRESNKWNAKLVATVLTTTMLVFASMIAVVLTHL